ncbi:hypothetical protein V6N13_073568 [Hibiscus sabdariffa]|uniref:S1-like domain-containing protein n=2 Tax=Hibiscus sabdariffa TaxID=183260 RepID=A0ABR2B1U9_9ROSI
MASLCSNLHTPFSFLVLPRQHKVPTCFFINSRVKFNPSKVSTRTITCKKASSRGPETDRVVKSYLSGKIRKNFVRVLPGDRVRVEMSPYDSTKGRIVYRLRNKDASG